MCDLSDLAAKHAPKPPAGLVIARGREIAAEGVDADAVFELGSITKAAGGLLLADAVVRGEVALDTTLDACLPGALPLRLADLASHTAGLPRLPLALLRRAGLRNPDPYAETTVDELVADLHRVRIRGPRRRYLDPPPEMAEAVALALTPRGGSRMLGTGLGWLRSGGMWWHNGGTRGSRSFTAFVPETGFAVAAVSNSARSVDGAAKAAFRP